MKNNFFLILITLLVFASCSGKNSEYASKDFFAMDTFVSVNINSDDENILNSTEKLLKKIENVFSKTIETSDVSKINSADSDASVSQECANVISDSLEIADETNGAFSITLGTITNLWDVNGKKYIPTAEEVLSALENSSYNDLSVNENNVTKSNKNILLDLGACVKGYAASECLKLFKDFGICDAMVSLGGNVGVIGNAGRSDNGWQIGIRNPYFPETLAGYIYLTDTVIAVSGDYERYFEKDGKRYHHIFDSKTGYPSDSGLCSAAVICKDGLSADALSTAIMVMGKEKAFELYRTSTYDFEAIMFSDDGCVNLTDGLVGKFILFENAMFSENQAITLINN